MKNTVCAYVYTMNSVYVLPLAENYHLRTVMYGVWHTYTVWTRFGPTLHLALCAWSRPPKRQSWPSWLIKRALHTLLFYSARLAHPLACLLQKPVPWCQLQILYKDAAFSVGILVCCFLNIVPQMLGTKLPKWHSALTSPFQWLHFLNGDLQPGC